MSKFIFNIAQHIAPEPYGVSHEALQSKLVDYVNVHDDYRRATMTQLLNSVSGQLINDVALETDASHDAFVRFIYEFIVSVQEANNNQTLRDHPELDPDCYTPPPEAIERDRQLDIDILHALDLH
jgi:hypothetical protein